MIERRPSWIAGIAEQHVQNCASSTQSYKIKASTDANMLENGIWKDVLLKVSTTFTAAWHCYDYYHYFQTAIVLRVSQNDQFYWFTQSFEDIS
jgi:hypothetical protein